MYKSLECADKNNNRVENKNNITLTKIESMKKVSKSHHAALVFDKHVDVNSITANSFHFEEDLESMKRRRLKRKRSGGRLVRCLSTPRHPKGINRGGEGHNATSGNVHYDDDGGVIVPPPPPTPNAGPRCNDDGDNVHHDNDGGNKQPSFSTTTPL